MADPRFFSRAGPFTLAELAARCGAEMRGGEAGAVFSDVAPLDSAGPEHVGFLDNKKYVAAFAESHAGACLVHPDMADRAPDGMALLVTEQPYLGYALVAAAFYPSPAPEAGVHEQAVVDPSARVGDGCRIEAGAVIGAGADVGARCLIGANTVVGDGVVLGADCRIGPNVTLAYCTAGDRVVIHAGACIGQAGFGFALVPGPHGFTDVPQLGRVTIGDDVDIGANTTIDRGAGPDTVIGAGTRIDNLCQIGHNVVMGKCCVLAGQVGISGSTKLGDFVMMGGQAGAAGHINIGDGAKVMAQSGLMRDVAPGASVMGSPALPAREFWRQTAAVGKLVKSKKKDG